MFSMCRVYNLLGVEFTPASSVLTFFDRPVNILSKMEWKKWVPMICVLALLHIGLALTFEVYFLFVL